MKLIQRLSLFASIALVAIACDIQQTFDDRINDKQLLVLAPDFADTSVQLVFRDPETLAVIDEDFEVTVYANKRLIDANGNYKNEFIARGGVMEFFVSPEETVSEGDPLEIAVDASSNNSSLGLNFYTTKASRSGFNSITLTPEDLPNLEEITANQQSIRPKTKEEILKETEDLSLDLSFNGKTFRNSFRIIIDSYNIYRFKNNDDRFGDYYLSDQYFFIGESLQENMKIEVEGPTHLLDYYLYLGYNTSNGISIYYTIKNDGGYFQTRRIKDTYDVIRTRGSIDNYMDAVFIGSNADPVMAEIEWRSKEYYKTCETGFNINFQLEGAQPGETTTVLYRGIRTVDGGNFMLASSNITSPGTMVNSLDHLDNNIIGVSGNTLEFAENAQYYIEPQTIELGGEELCGNTYTVKLIPRENHSKYNLNLSMRCEEDEVGVAPTFSALYRKKGGDEASWESVSFKKGSTSLYLEEGAVYEVKGTFSERAFEFEFTNEASKIAEAVSGTRNGNTAVKDITYTIESGDTGSQSINANVVFYAADCLIN